MIMARIGDVVKARVSAPTPGTFVVTLRTPEAVAYANELLNDPTKSGWYRGPVVNGKGDGV